MATTTKAKIGSYPLAKVGECEVTIRENNLNVTYKFKTRNSAVKCVKDYLKRGWAIDDIRVLMCIDHHFNVMPVWIDITNDIEQAELESVEPSDFHMLRVMLLTLLNLADEEKNVCMVGPESEAIRNTLRYWALQLKVDSEIINNGSDSEVVDAIERAYNW